jgi:hypothetical protein
MGTCEMNMRDPNYFKRLGEKTCECECHHVDKNILHFMPCCDVTGKSYIVNGEINNNLLAKAYGEMRK